MKGVILVGGEGTRLRPLTSLLPKPMVPIVNQPFLALMIGWIRSHGIEDIVLALGYLPDRIRDQLGDGSGLGVRLAYVVEETPLGTAGAVRNAAGHIDDTCFVFNGDILTDLDLGAMLKAHRAAGAKISISLTPVDDPSMYGVVESDERGRITRFTEKPKREDARSNLINAGTYIIEPDVLERIPEGKFCMFERQIFPELLEIGETLLAFPSDAYWIDIGTPEKYREVNHDLLTGKIATTKSLLRSDGLFFADGCEVDPSATIEGPVVVGAGSRIGPGAVVRGPTVIGASCTVAGGATVVSSILWDRVTIERGATVEGAIVGDGCRIASGALIGEAFLGSNVVVEGGNWLDRAMRVSPGHTVPAGTISFGKFES